MEEYFFDEANTALQRNNKSVLSAIYSRLEEELNSKPKLSLLDLETLLNRNSLYRDFEAEPYIPSSLQSGEKYTAIRYLYSQYI